MRVLRRAAPIALAVLMCTGAVAAGNRPGASAGHHGGGRADVVPAPRLAGVSGGKLLGQWVAQLLAIPAPQTYEPMCLRVGRHSDVLAPSGEFGEAPCTIRAGTPLLLVGDASDCSSNEAPPFHADTAAEQRACALGTLADDGVVAATVSVDGRPPVNIRQDDFLVVSPQKRTAFAPNPDFGVTPGPGTFVVAGYVATVRQKLRTGHHVIVIQAVPAEGDPATLTIDLTVVGHNHGH